MVLTNQGPGGDGQDSNDSRDFQAKMEGLLFRERQAIKRQVKILSKSLIILNFEILSSF